MTAESTSTDSVLSLTSTSGPRQQDQRRFYRSACSRRPSCPKHLQQQQQLNSGDHLYNSSTPGTTSTAATTAQLRGPPLQQQQQLNSGDNLYYNNNISTPGTTSTTATTAQPPGTTSTTATTYQLRDHLYNSSTLGTTSTTATTAQLRDHLYNSNNSSTPGPHLQQQQQLNSRDHLYNGNNSSTPGTTSTTATTVP